MANTLGWDVVLDHLLDAAMLFGENGVLIRWNHAAVELLGLAAKTAADPSQTGIEFFDAGGNPLQGRAAPLAGALADGAARSLDGFVRHANGHLVPVAVRTAHIPASGGCPGAVFLLLRDHSETTVLRRQVEDLRDQALIDPATGAAGRTYAELQLVSRLAEFERYGWSFGAVHVSIDRWDDLARRVGEVHRRELVKLVADSLLHAARSSDLVARWGDGEFLVLLTNVADATIRASAERYRRVIEQGQRQAYGEDVHVTVSVGASSARRNDSVGGLVTRLQGLVDRSRAGGGNQVGVAE